VPLEEWVDLPALKAFCQHVSTFALGAVIGAAGKLLLKFAALIGLVCHMPIAPWLLRGLGWADDLFLAYYVLGLLWKAAKELWPWRAHHIILLAGLYERAFART